MMEIAHMILVVATIPIRVLSDPFRSPGIQSKKDIITVIITIIIEGGSVNTGNHYML